MKKAFFHLELDLEFDETSDNEPMGEISRRLAGAAEFFDIGCDDVGPLNGHVFEMDGWRWNVEERE